MSSTSYAPSTANGVRTLLIHIPQSPQRAFTVGAIDTLRYEGVEEEWFRHLPSYAGHTVALDLSIKAIVAACAYKRGVAKITAGDCYQALATALYSVQVSIVESNGELGDDMLASTALLARFDGEVKKNGIPTRPHVEGLAAILASRSSIQQASQLSRDILDFHAGESAIIACVQGRNSPFEKVAREYFASDWNGDSDRSRLKALSNEIFINLPRLVGIVRVLRAQSSPEPQLVLDASRLLQYLLDLQNYEVEERLLREVEMSPTNQRIVSSFPNPSLHFSCYKDYEALAYYWQSRLSLLRLQIRLQSLRALYDGEATGNDAFASLSQDHSREEEMIRLMRSILMCSDYAATLRLNKHIFMLIHALTTVWGALKDVTLCAHDLMPDTLLERINTALRTKPNITAEEADIAAEIFVGGPSKGRFAKRFSL